MRRTAADVYDELIAKGEARGEAKGKVDLLLKLGARLFGEASDRAREHLGSLTSERLDAVADRLLQATSWDDALGGSVTPQA